MFIYKFFIESLLDRFMIVRKFFCWFNLWILVRFFENFVINFYCVYNIFYYVKVFDLINFKLSCKIIINYIL